jgi:hypothetical protein
MAKEKDEGLEGCAKKTFSVAPPLHKADVKRDVFNTEFMQQAELELGKLSEMELKVFAYGEATGTEDRMRSSRPVDSAWTGSLC